MTLPKTAPRKKNIKLALKFSLAILMIFIIVIISGMLYLPHYRPPKDNVAKIDLYSFRNAQKAFVKEYGQYATDLDALGFYSVMTGYNFYYHDIPEELKKYIPESERPYLHKDKFKVIYHYSNKNWIWSLDQDGTFKVVK